MNGCFAIIPARGGSKRLPRKNIVPLFGKPLLAWSIEAAMTAHCLDGVYVSTDDPDIEAVAKKFGAGVIRRPDDLSDDKTPKMEAIRHAYNALKSQGKEPEIVVSLQANSPELRASDIDRAVHMLRDNGLWEVLSVDNDGVQNAAIRVIHKDCLFNSFLSAHIGVVETSSLDVHTAEDIESLQRKYLNADALTASMKS
jgi:CMP-N-acetylneuraminic acid synthetase